MCRFNLRRAAVLSNLSLKNGLNRQPLQASLGLNQR